MELKIEFGDDFFIENLFLLVLLIKSSFWGGKFEKFINEKRIF